jgi:hypothetical protein
MNAPDQAYQIRTQAIHDPTTDNAFNERLRQPTAL